MPGPARTLTFWLALNSAGCCVAVGAGVGEAGIGVAVGTTVAVGRSSGIDVATTVGVNVGLGVLVGGTSATRVAGEPEHPASPTTSVKASPANA